MSALRRHRQLFLGVFSKPGLVILAGTTLAIACATQRDPSSREQSQAGVGGQGVGGQAVGGQGGEAAGGTDGGTGSMTSSSGATGGMSPSTGGTGGTSASGGGTGGNDGPSVGFCDDGDVTDCSKVFAKYPAGQVTCVNHTWPPSDCKICLEGDTIDCGLVPGNDEKPNGMAVCDPEGASGKGAWDTSTCEICDPGVTTIDCVEVTDGEQVFTGGTATCDETGTGWDTTSCSYCGDGTQNGNEQCDGSDVTPTTCGDLDFGGVDPNTVIDQCLPGCVYDTAACGNCSGGVQAGMCMEGGTCSGNDCDGKGCARDATCQFDCYENVGTCENTICSEGADCTFQCYAGSGCPGASCSSGSTCEFRCWNPGGDCTDISCEDASCTFLCQNGGTCSTDGTARCKDGETCTINCENDANCTDVSMVCESGSTCHIILANNDLPPTVDCESGATCHLNCQNRSCDTISCEGPGCNCNVGTCPNF